jgi:hypothetical protein
MNTTLPIMLALCTMGSAICLSGCTIPATRSIVHMPMIKCTPVVSTSGNDSDDERRIYTANDKDSQRVCIEAITDHDQILLSITSSTGSIVLPPCPIDDRAIMVYVGTPWFGDLNADSKQDYFLSVSMGGCGMAAGYENAVIVLSGPNGYRIRIIPTYSASPDDLVDTNGDGIAELIMRTGDWSDDEEEWLIETEIIAIAPQSPAFRSPEWLESVDSILGVSDQDGHGPDSGSDEWRRAVDERLPDDRRRINIDSVDTDRWYRHVDQAVFWKYEE